MDYEFRTDAPNGLSQLDSIFGQLREQVASGRVVNVLVTKTGKTTIVIDPLTKGLAMPLKGVDGEPDEPTDLDESAE